MCHGQDTILYTLISTVVDLFLAALWRVSNGADVQIACQT
jgi:hypothetical protein